MTDIIASSFIFAGALFVFIGTLGLLRLPDVFCRGHALTKAMTLGTTFIFGGAMFFFDHQADAIKLFVAMAFQFATIPLSGHILGLVALRKNVPRFKHRDTLDC
ncbi:monovalent cation/H(+) antiporter subunit G [bacterium]|jgi:multicomponent Na+:H+ antiporter subunit G|nr:monovalent cation/H(+) antiporter subunit G [bacterium]